MNKKETCANPITIRLSGGGGACNPLIATVSGLFGKFTHTGWGFAKKGTKLLGHWGSKVNRHSEALAEEFLLKGTKLLRHYGTESNCHPELVSGSQREQMLKQVQHDKGVLKKCAFTLSEVLIVLAVLGVIATMTIPDLVQDYQEKALITALKKNYSIFSQAVDMAQADNGSITTWDIGSYQTSAGALKLYEILRPYLRIEKYCGIGRGCFASNYKALFADSVYGPPDDHWIFAKGILASGASFGTWSGGTGCPNNHCGAIILDVNGKAAPNKAGVDYFYLEITTDGLRPMGQVGPKIYFCLYNNSSNMNGWACTYWALKHENMDYLRKAGCYYGSCK